MDTRLQRAISTPKILQQAGELIRLSFRALDDLKQLDESLYERFLATRKAPEDPVAAEAGLRKLWDESRSAASSTCSRTAARSPASSRSRPASDERRLRLRRLRRVGAGRAAPTSTIGANDIGDLLEGLDDVSVKDDTERWKGVVEKVVSIEYGLTSQLKEARERLDVALRAGETNQVLGLLDDTQSSSSEGVHALVAAVYETFVPDVAPATVVPGYLTSLGRALLVRRGLADLATKLTLAQRRAAERQGSRRARARARPGARADAARS